MFEIRSAGDMGSGLFAAADISKGTRILAEAPLILLKPVPKPFAKFRQLVNELGDDKSKLDDLTYNPRLLDRTQPDNIFDKVRSEGVTGPGRRTDPDFNLMVERYAKFYTNSAEIKSSKNDIGAGVFSTFSRINHSCVPNAFSNWNADIGRQTVQAARDIKAGEQIFFSYLGREGTFRKREDRAVTLEKCWGFVCSCSDCGQSQASDALRERMNRLDRDLSRISELCQTVFSTLDECEPAARTAIIKIKRLVTLMERANLGGWKLVEA